LEQQLATRPTVESHQSLKQRLTMLEELQFSSIKDDQMRSKSIEQLLHEKNRVLEDQLTKLRLQISDAEQELEKSKLENSSLSQRVTTAEELCKKLENDLLTTKQQGTGTVPTTVNVDPSAQTEDQNTMLQIVSEQRNRFRKRLNEVEEENQSLTQQLNKSRHELDKLQKDNVKLYEKIRYLQSYKGETSSSETMKQRAITIHDDNTEEGYKKIYEQQLDPFTQFHREERNEQFKKLSAAEKITFRMSRIMLSHKYSRLFVFFYLIALHLLVFATVYRLSSTVAWRR
jgi:homeobox protein cut-like